jgi:hypothetical protein
MQIIHYGLFFSGNIDFDYQVKMVVVNLIVVLTKVKVNRLSISGHSLQDK